ncbi:DUF2846 domain-containing protein [Pseudomonas sp. DP-17]|uniref:DUF2846 domain-containing protein n=1 Tax=Pseudomonas sp. DP-17 TaxID=1580486 RepID=UPI001EFB2865|nr:DUF2846 domain-containing protein [Pseudomonas sp. DP-17]MCG8909305.1 DUF2846 domain-containing protein [Pseudomonas sp. DP-17]
MIKAFRSAAWMVAATLLSACSTVDLTGQPFFYMLEQPHPDQATLYFYRVKPTLGSKFSRTISINGKAVGQLPGGSYFVTHADAGRIHVVAEAVIGNESDTEFDLDIEEGKTYFIADQENTSPYENDGKALSSTIEARFRPTTYYYRFALVPMDDALRALKWCQQSPPVSKR